MGKARKFDPQGPSTPPEWAGRDAWEIAEASESPPLASCGGVPPALPQPAHGLRQVFNNPPASGSVPERPANRRNALGEKGQEAVAAPPSEAGHPSDPDASLRLSAPRLSGRLAALAETAKAYARSAQADNTQRAYAADWRHFASWLRRQGLAETPPDPEAVGLYLAAQVERGGAELSVATLERRLSGIAWRYRQMGASRSRSGTGTSPPCSPASAAATLALRYRRRPSSPTSFWRCWRRWTWTSGASVTGPSWRSASPAGCAASEIVGLDCGLDHTDDGSGWVEIFPEGALLTIRVARLRPGARSRSAGARAPTPASSVALLETWLRLGRIASRAPVPGRSA